MEITNLIGFNMIYHFYNKYQAYFDEQKSTVVVINKQAFDELYNIGYYLSTSIQDEFLEQNYKPHLQADEDERNNIITYFKSKAKLFKKDKYTRQLVYTPKYIGNEDLSACLSLFQLIFRNNKLHLHIHVRSQHFENNFLYDNQTYSILLDEISKLYKVDRGLINVKIISLHKNI